MHGIPADEMLRQLSRDQTIMSCETGPAFTSLKGGQADKNAVGQGCKRPAEGWVAGAPLCSHNSWL